jgi:alkylation response protein AidB-like acyl-CoA dehydrogenase
MNFGFDEEQTSLGDTVGQLLADHAGLLAPETGKGEQAAALAALTDLGLFALLVPEEFGGASLSLVDVALAAEALGAGLAPPLAAETLAATDVLLRHGSENQKQIWLPRIAAGEANIAVAAMEAGQGDDPLQAACTFAGGVLNGTKILVPQAASAAALLVMATTPQGTELVLVDRETPGIVITPHEDIDPSSAYCQVKFSGVVCGNDAVLGAGAALRLLDVGAALSAVMQTGIAARMLDTAVEYAKTRMQFGQPIGAFQAIKHRCADMATSLEAARSAAYFAFWAVAEDAPERAKAVSMAKLVCGESARSICNETIQVHGGMGFTWELGLHRFLRRARALEYAYGDAAWHGERIVSEALVELETAR